MAAIKMCFPEGKTKALTLSYDDGVEQDAHLIEIMKKHGLKGTFNLNSGAYKDPKTIYPEGQIHRRMSEEEVTNLYSKSGMEVACHALTHPSLTELPANLCMKEILCDREKLEKQFHTIVRGFAYPYGTFNDNVVSALKQAGIVYARTVISSHDFGVPTDWLRLEATCHHNDPILMELARKFIAGETWQQPELFYLWGHSYEFEQNNNWNIIEEFADYMGGREDIWYATNMEIYEYVEDYKRLIFSMDGTMVQNPTARNLYFLWDGKEYCVKAGQTLYIEL